MGKGIMKRRHRKKVNAQARRAVRRGRRKSNTNSKRRAGWKLGIRSKGYKV